MYQKRNLEIGIRYEAELGKLNFSILDNKTVEELYHDGRIIGRMIEPLLAEIFNDFKCIVGGNNKFDLIRISDNSEGEIKVFTKNGCNLIPSCQIGKGRKYDREEYHKRVKQMGIYFIVDVRDFPKIKIIALDSDHILKNYSDGRYSKSKKNVEGKVQNKILKSSKIIDLGLLE